MELYGVSGEVGGQRGWVATGPHTGLFVSSRNRMLSPWAEPFDIKPKSVLIKAY